MSSYGSTPVVNGGIYPDERKDEWKKAIDKNINTYVLTKNDPASMITLQLSGELPLIHSITVFNRIDSCQDYILGCELQVLDRAGNVTRRWAFSDVNSSRGLPAYRVSTDNNFVMVPM